MKRSEGTTRRAVMAGMGAATAASLTVGVATPAGAVEINAMGPTPEQMQAFLALPDAPIVMVNLLKFKPNGGQAEYAKYGTKIQPLLAKVGARSLFSGQAQVCLVGSGDWDMIALVEYPRPRALIEMVQSPEYQAIHHHREAGLEGQVNYAVSQTSFG